jgi:MerR family transcriptional regulator, copper efflux regulator
MARSHGPITVGQAARRSGLTQKAIRLYEMRGLLPPAQRTESGYRTYTQQEVALLRFIRRAKSLGLRLEEIREIIDLERGGTQPCDKVLQLLGAHIQEIDRTVRDLRALRKSLMQARDAAAASDERGEDVVICRIIEGPQAAS